MNKFKLAGLAKGLAGWKHYIETLLYVRVTKFSFVGVECIYPNTHVFILISKFHENVHSRSLVFPDTS